MANKKISEAASKASLLDTDMIPVAQAGSTTAYHITGQNLFASAPAASTAARGQVELATQAETQAGADAERAVTPASLAGAIGPKNLAAGFCYIGDVIPISRANIDAAYLTTFGRTRQLGDLIVCKDINDAIYILVWEPAAGRWYGINASAGAFVNFG